MTLKTLTTLLIFSFFVTIPQIKAQEDIKIKIMNATHLENHQVVIALKTPGESDPVVVETVDLGKFRDYTNVSVPHSEQIFLFVIPSSTTIEKLNPVPSDYTAKLYPLGMDGVKGCNIVISGDHIDDVHYNMTNIQW
ncbi:MAG: hypothetical protein ACPGJS_07115 [Flammeovirgaceae bacterium]